MSTEIRQGHLQDIVTETLRDIVTETLRELVRQRVDAAAAPPVRVPLMVRNDADLSELVQWFRRLCGCSEARERFVRGEIQLDVRLSEAVSRGVADRGASGHRIPGAQHAMPEAQVLDDGVVTEATLRRRGLRNQTLMLRARTVVTPSARDYARSVGIDLQKERGSGS